MFILASLVIIAQSVLFAVVWYSYYRGLIFEPFWNKGNWVLIAMYALLLILFSRLFGGLRVGYLKRLDLFGCGDLSADHADQPLVPVTHPAADHDAGAVRRHRGMDVRLPLYIQPSLWRQADAGDLWGAQT